ncbi:MAG: cytidine deaminase [Candidatus Kapabacteria bacterium]|nr:cytidine deaminase [Candidatus Kapabacteria bacterium]MDW8225974.1 cytidine deaminase [Bacteroidota bacterium]
MLRERLRQRSWQAAAVAYYFLHAPQADSNSQNEAYQWCSSCRDLFDSFVAQLERTRQAAVGALQHAWAPYSHFPVGAALLAADGTIWAGCNVECSSYGLTLCAERVALGHAVVNGRKEFVLLSLVAETEHPISPCGGCRQLLHDFSPQLLVVSEGIHHRHPALWWLDQLLPEPFSGRDIWKR